MRMQLFIVAVDDSGHRADRRHFQHSVRQPRPIESFSLISDLGARLVAYFTERARGWCARNRDLRQEGRMRILWIVRSGLGALMPLALALAPELPARASDLPGYFKEIVRPETATPADVSVKNVLQLNKSMFELYGDAAQIFQRNFLSNHPVILGLFSGAGGRFILYRPGQAPLELHQFRSNIS